MGKRIAVILIIGLVSALAIMGFFLWRSSMNLTTDPYKTVTPDASIVIETVDIKSLLNSLTTGRGLFGELGKIRDLSVINHDLKYLADLLNKPNLKKLFVDQATIISFHTDSKGKLQPVISMPVPGDLKLRHVKEMFNSLGINDLTQNKVNGKFLIALPFHTDNLKDTAYISLVSGILISSSSKELVESASVQIDRETDIRKLPGFSRVLLASGKNVDKIFISFLNLPDLLKPLLNIRSKRLAGKAAGLAGTAGGDIYISEDGLVLSGYTESTDS